MNVTILTYGSRGDVQPFLALAVGLQDAGYTVRLAAPHRFADFIENRNIPFVPLAGDPEIISERLNNAGENPIGMIRAISDYVFSIGDQVICQSFDACKNADLIIHSFLFTTGGHSLARKLGVPDISVQTFPVFAPTRFIPPVALPNLPLGYLSYFFHWLITQVFWHGGNLGYRRVKKQLPSIYDLDLFWPFAPHKNRIKTPLVLACSPTVISRPDDWTSPHIQISGYLFLDTHENYQPPSVLTEFLTSGEPPICVTFGSMINRDAKRIYRIVLDALKRNGSRAIILSGWGELNTIQLSENVLLMESVPHDWLLPRCKAIVHHGGAGTTAAGLRSGIPNLVIHFAADQTFWGIRVHSLGAGPKPIPVKKITTEKLLNAFSKMESDAIRTAGQVTGRKVRVENGVANLVQLVNAYLKK